jgi:small subunit ribosomal protein S8
MHYNLNNLISILNLSSNRKIKECFVPCTKINKKIIYLLLSLGFINNFTINIDKKYISVILKYNNELDSAIKKIKIISKPGNKIYINYKNIIKLSLKKTTGIFLLSTSKGIVTSQQAYKLKIGGEVLLYIQ